MPESDSERRRRFDELFASYGSDIVAYCTWRVGPAGGAQDAVAEVFLAAWRRLDDVPEGGAARPWLYATARRVIANQRRASRRRLALHERLTREASAQAVPSTSDQEEGLVNEALRCLGPRDGGCTARGADSAPSSRSCSPATTATTSVGSAIPRSRLDFAKEDHDHVRELPGPAQGQPPRPGRLRAVRRGRGRRGAHPNRDRPRGRRRSSATPCHPGGRGRHIAGRCGRRCARRHVGGERPRGRGRHCCGREGRDGHRRLRRALGNRDRSDHAQRRNLGREHDPLARSGSGPLTRRAGATRQGQRGLLVVDGTLYGPDPGTGGWLELGSPASIDPGSGTTPAEYLAAVREDTGGATLRRITGGMIGLTTSWLDDGSTVYSGSVAAGLIARESGFKGGTPIRVLPFGYVAHDEAADPSGLLRAAVTVGADGVVREIAVRWGGADASAWTYTVWYGDLGSAPAPVAPENASPLKRG